MMNRHRGMASAVGAAAVWGAAALVVAGAAGAWAVPATRGAVPAATSWGRAIAVPGLRALNEGHHAVVRSVSCGSAGNCAAGGNYRDRLGHGQGFVVSETNGRWSPAIKVPGLPALNKGQQSRVVSVSCASAGNCVAGGYYRDRSRGYQSFVVNESNGVWRRAIEVPGLRTLNTAGKGETSSVSCASAGDCAAVGYYGGRSGIRGFVVSEQHGRWRRAIAVPGLTALAAGGSSEVISVSCASAGNCAVGGHYGYKHQKPEQGFVASEHNGVWGHAIEVPGLSALNRDFVAGVRSMSCASAGNCAAVGGYTDSRGRRQGFVASEHNGVWGHAIEVPGLSALNIGGDARVVWVSCASAGNCAAVGGYADGHGHGQGFVIIERQGAWHRAIKVPGLGALNTGGDAGFRAVSCVSPWTCAAGGYYAKRSGHLHYQGFVSRS
jgi:hypothetical protein